MLKRDMPVRNRCKIPWATLLENINAALPFMDADMWELAGCTMQKLDALIETEYAELAVYAADEV